MPAVGCGHTETLPAACPKALLLHQALNTLLAHAHALGSQLPPDPRPAVRPPMLLIRGPNMHRQCFLALMPSFGDPQQPGEMFVITRHTHLQHAALNANGPDLAMTSNKGVPHLCSFAKYAVAFPRMSRSIFTRASSARNLTLPAESVSLSSL